jgi:hypothetical protein
MSCGIEIMPECSRASQGRPMATSCGYMKVKKLAIEVKQLSTHFCFTSVVARSIILINLPGIGRVIGYSFRFTSQPTPRFNFNLIFSCNPISRAKTSLCYTTCRM